MLKAIALFVCIVACTQAETASNQFMGFGGNIPQVIAQEQIYRRFADIMLGLQVSSNFQQMAQLEYHAKTQRSSSSTPEVFSPDWQTESDSIGLAEAIHNEYVADDSSDSDDVFLELKEEFTPMMGMGMYGMGMGMPQHPQQAQNPDDMEHQAHHHKMVALKNMHIQYYFAAGDVERSHWVNKMLAALLPPQLTMFKVYKNYINTMALAIAFQFHDQFTFEGYMDDFNDRFRYATAHDSDSVESMAEQGVYQKWFMLSTFKYQLFLMSMYERQMMAQVAQPPQAAQEQAFASAASAASYLEEGSEFVGGASDPHGLVMQYMQMQYYGMMMKMYAIFAEMQVGQAGMMAASIKMQLAQGNDVAVQGGNSQDFLHQLDSQYVPMAISSWSTINQYRYMFEYFGAMIEMQIPPLAAHAAAERAENTFQNLMQAGPAETTPAKDAEEPAAAAPAPAAPAAAAPAPAPAAAPAAPAVSAEVDPVVGKTLAPQ